MLDIVRLDAPLPLLTSVDRSARVISLVPGQGAPCMVDLTWLRRARRERTLAAKCRSGVALVALMVIVHPCTNKP